MRFAVLMLLAHLAFAQSAPTAEALFDAKLMEQVREIDAHLDGVLGVYAIDLNTGRSLSYHGDTVFALSTGDDGAHPDALAVLAVELTAQAIRRAVLAAESAAVAGTGGPDGDRGAAAV